MRRLLALFTLCLLALSPAYADFFGGITGSSTDVTHRSLSATFINPAANDTVTVYIPANYTITGSEIVSDTSCSAQVDVWTDTGGNYPPTVADTITASAKPTLSSGTRAVDTTMTGWTLPLTRGYYAKFNMDSTSGCGLVVVTLQLVTRL